MAPLEVYSLNYYGPDDGVTKKQKKGWSFFHKKIEICL